MIIYWPIISKVSETIIYQNGYIHTCKQCIAITTWKESC